MATHDYSLANQSGASFRTDLNNALAAIQSNNSHSSSPTTTVAYQWWADTTANIFKIRNSGNNAWINLFTLAGGIDVDAASSFGNTVTFAGDVTFDGATAGRDIVFDQSANALTFADSAVASFGASGDFRIFHNGSDSILQDQGTGSLIVLSNLFHVKNAANNEDLAKFTEDAGCELFFNNVKKLETVSGGVDITGDLIVDGAAGGTLTIGGQGAHTSKVVIADNAGSGNGNLAIQGGDGTEFFRILSNGNVRFEDNEGVFLGSDSDLSLVHDGTNSIINDNAGGNFIIKSTNGNVRIESNGQVALGDIGNSESFATFVDNGAVSLFFDNTVRAATVSNGFTVKNKLFLARETGTTADYANFRIAFYQSIPADSSHTFQVGSVHAMGTVQIFGSRGATANNATLATGKIFPIHVRSGATAGLGSQIGSDLGGASGGFSYTVAAASQGITITNGSSSFAMNTFVSFDLTGFVG